MHNHSLVFTYLGKHICYNCYLIQVTIAVDHNNYYLQVTDVFTQVCAMIFDHNTQISLLQ